MPDQDTMSVILGAIMVSILLLLNWVLSVWETRFRWLSPPMMKTIITIGDSPLLILLAGLDTSKPLFSPKWKEYLLIGYVIYCGISCIIFIYHKTWLERVVIICVVIVGALIWGFGVFGMWTMIRADFRCDLKLIAGEKRCDILNRMLFHVFLCLFCYGVKLLSAHIHFGKKNDLDLRIVIHAILKMYCDQQNITADGNTKDDYVRAIERNGRKGDFIKFSSKANV
jgi:hypothetical protein